MVRTEPSESTEMGTLDLRDGGRVLTPRSTVADALAVLTATGQPALVVMDGDRPAGVVTRAELVGRGEGPPPPDATLGEILAWVCLRRGERGPVSAGGGASTWFG